MKVLRIVLLILLLIVVVIAVGGFLIFNDTTRGPLPVTSGTLNVTGLQAQVEVLRDDWGVPHIYASNPHDLFFAQGFTQAQDRWWQMEFARHVGAGTIQELTGQTASVMGSDLFIRTAGWYEAAQRDVALLDETETAAVQAFADGVNAYITSRPQDDLALEYRLLGVTGVNITIAPWTIADSLVWGKVMAWNLTDSYGSDMDNALLLDALGQALFDDLTPPFPFDSKPTILQAEDLPITEASLSTAYAGSRAALTVPASRAAAGGIVRGDWVTRSTDVGIGSNNWVATGTMTSNGTPLLANDPHLGIQMPSIWYEIGLHCYPVTAECPYDVVGFALPASPAVIIGHNANIAWGVTNVGADVQDLYSLEINPDNPTQYRWDGEWRDMNVREETINFGDGDEPVTIQVRETHLGPIINDNRYDSETGEISGWNSEDPMVLRWTGLDEGTLYKSVLRLNLASNWDEFRAALSYWNVPAQNFVYADTAGNIGYQTPGSMPIRPGDRDGRFPTLATSDADTWQGYIPFDLLPRILNPERDFVVTANQAVVPPDYYAELETALGADNFYELGYSWSYGYRGERINELMDQLKAHNASTYQTIHGDDLNINAREIVPFLNGLQFTDQSSTEARDFLLSWDYQMVRDSGQAALYAVFSVSLLDNLFNDQLPEDIRANTGDLYPASRLMNDPENAWWDDARTADVVERRDEILVRAFDEAVVEIVRRQGNNPAEWSWGELHTATWESNPLGLSGISLIEDMVNRGPYPVDGGGEIVNATGWGIDYGTDAVDATYTVRALPSMRMIVDVANWENSQSMHTTGQSGHPYSPHYNDMISPWTEIRYHPMLWSRTQVERATADRLILSPAG
ncbi:MAG: penicillin acylase family protein [Anaerolineae bacterium]|nr:penicillin acylase family protein [Anaerolineae bacterium]